MTQTLDRMQCRVLNELTKKLIYGYGYCIFDKTGVVLFDDRGQEIKVDHGYCLLKKLQFSTGLKDKNGKLIYDGDILRYELLDEDGNVCEEDDAQYVVGFKNGSFGTYYSYNKHTKGFEDFEAFPTKSEAMYQDFEIVGNRFENPELLEK